MLISKCLKSAFHRGSFTRLVAKDMRRWRSLLDDQCFNGNSRVKSQVGSSRCPCLQTNLLYRIKKFLAWEHEFSQTVCEIFVKLLLVNRLSYMLEKKYWIFARKWAKSRAHIKATAKSCFSIHVRIRISYCQQFQFPSNIRNDLAYIIVMYAY